jgi:hypothetical protein
VGDSLEEVIGEASQVDVVGRKKTEDRRNDVLFGWHYLLVLFDA